MADDKKRVSVKKFEETTFMDEVKVEEEMAPPVMVEEVKEEVIPAAPVAPSSPKMYMCHVTCWVASKKQVFNPGDVVQFEAGEYVPDFFKPL